MQLLALFTPSFIFGLIVLFYLLTFVLFAVIRIATGISIQRIGYFSLRRIAYTPRDGIKLDIRGLGLHLHRPTFARPTWISLRFTDLKVTVDFKVLSGKGAKGHQDDAEEQNTRGGRNRAPGAPAHPSIPRSSILSDGSGPHSRTWKRLTQLKDRIKALHGQINWLRMVDVDILNSNCVVVDVGTIQIGSLTIAVDTRRRTVDRGRLFRHKKVGAGEQQPAEWMFVVKGVLFTPDGKDSLEIVDICSLNVHGLLFKDLAGLRDASVSLKLGRMHIPYDDIMHCITRISKIRSLYAETLSSQNVRDVLFEDLIQEVDVSKTREETIVRAVSDSKEFIASLLRGIQEIQLAISFIGLSKGIDTESSIEQPLFLNFAMNEFGIDLFRLDPKSPAHRQYFSSKDIAHQALLAAISMGISINDGDGKPERLLYIPMATTTVKTTLPSKTINDAADGNVAERNANILFANLVVTSPSVDLDLKHMPVVLRLLNKRGVIFPERGSSMRRQQLISGLLPKANVRISIQEPVARIVLPPSDPNLQMNDDFDLLISSVSSMSLHLESSHSSVKELHYSLTSNLRISSQHLYYQTASGHRHNLLINDALELKVQINATPEVSVIAIGNLETLSIHMIRPEISEGVRQIMKQFSKNIPPVSFKGHSTTKHSSLRSVPSWLTHLQLKGSNFGVEIAGIDPEVSLDVRGVALQVDSWTTDYRIQKNAGFTKNRHIHRVLSGSANSEQSFHRAEHTKERSAISYNSTDGRRISATIQGFQGFVVEGLGKWEHEPFVAIPSSEVFALTSSDSQGLISHVNCQIKSIGLQFSLYRYYASCVAQKVLQRAFGRSTTGQTSIYSNDDDDTQVHPKSSIESAHTEHLNVDTKVGFLQIKATMPSDPCVMLQLSAAEFGRHRWAAPYLKCRLVKLCVEAPKIRSAWSSIASVKNARIDLRESRRKFGKDSIEENSVDVSSEITKLVVPHQLVLHRVFDNFVNVLKAIRQLKHQLRTGSSDHVAERLPERPKTVPRVSFRSRTLMFELEDGPFEWKLGLIYRIGLNEQKQRLARDEAYKVKMKRLDENNQRREGSRFRPQTTKYASPEIDKPGRVIGNSEEIVGAEPHLQRQSSSHSDLRGRKMRYDTEAGSGLTENANISGEEAWIKLQEHNAASWRKRIAAAMKHQSDAMKDIQSIFWGNEEDLEMAENSETILITPKRPGLMSTFISDLHVVMDKPSFPIGDYAQYLHKVGKGIPFNMQYSLLIPMSIQINMGEARVTLRNYPLPLLHVPSIKNGQSSRLPSWSLKTDFVIAEEYRDEESVKCVKVEIIPANKYIHSYQNEAGFSVAIKRTVSPVKTYSDVDVSINTINPTSITWGTSYQPAIQDMMQIIENFTKPQVDPSERVGFWDKIRLVFHSRVRVAWRGDGDVHLKLKGSRDPYVVTGHGAGFMMCFHEEVRWDIHQDDDPKKFMTVSCGEYVLAVPDYGSQARSTSRGGTGQEAESVSSNKTFHNKVLFQKVIMKLSGQVRWLAGLVFERDLAQGRRSFEFSPHYSVTFKTPKCARPVPGQIYDAFRGFRSQHIHLSIAVIAPVDRDWSVTNSKPSSSYNSFHMSPRFFTHFYAWWSLFSGVMALPIRQGKLFPGLEKSNKKFGRHLATIKYNLLLSPFYIAHIYKHKDVEDYSEDTVGATGLKLRIDSFILDLHQRREEFSSQGKGRLKMTRTSGMRINKAQLDFVAADIRAVSASIAGTSVDDLKRATDEDLSSLHKQAAMAPDISKFSIPDNDFMWIDMDDFVELDWILPAETHPETKIMPLAFAPRFTYFRQTDHHGIVAGDLRRKSNFGDEPTHFCIMSQDNDPHRVQCDLVNERVVVLEEQVRIQRQTLMNIQARTVKDDRERIKLTEKIDSIQKRIDGIENNKAFMQDMLYRLMTDIRVAEPRSNYSQQDTVPSSIDRTSNHEQETKSDFNNRFIVHNIQLKWNNSLRNIILRYVHQVSQRRGFVYYMSRRAVKFILDIVEEQQRSKTGAEESHLHTPATQPSPSTSSKDDIENFDLEERIKDLLNDGKAFVDANDPHQPMKPSRHASADIRKDISEEFTAQNSYHVRLIAPQIQLQSEKNARSALLVTGKGMELKVVQIMDKHRLADDVSGLVQRRFSVDMDGVQFFITNQKTFNDFIQLYTANRYGSPEGTAWPPWVPLEANFDFQINPFGWFRVVQKTSASLRYDKYNTLRLKYNDEVSTAQNEGVDAIDDESRLDHLWVEFPQIRAICDSVQYYAMYVIVLDLLLYNEPLEKSRSERLEKIMLAADFSDLTGAPEMVISLQGRIRQLEEIKGHFQLHAKQLDRQGWQDRLSVEKDLASCEDELFFIMKAITTAQRKHDDRSQNQSTGLLRWYLSANEIVWHLMREDNEPLVEIQLNHAAYDRTDNSDGSNYNSMEIEKIHGLNLLPDALYPEMIAPFFESYQNTADRKDPAIKMFKVQWYMLEAIAGIPVLDQFEVNLFPLKIQLERDVGKRVFEYIFPDHGDSSAATPFMVKQISPTEDDKSTTLHGSHLISTDLGVSERGNSPLSTWRDSVELRPRPALTISEAQSRPTSSSSGNKGTATSSINNDLNRFKFFQQTRNISRSQSSLHLSQAESRKQSRDSLQPPLRQTPEASYSNFSGPGNADKPRKFGLTRSLSKEGNNEKYTDDLTEMVSRASSYMTLAYVKIPSVVLCLSYKGRSERNIEDVHNFVFRMPSLEYRNKTWSNLDLALRLKKDVIKALISHTGAIIGNKFSHHRPTKYQQSRLREVANSASLLPTTDDFTDSLSISEIFRQSSIHDRQGDREPSSLQRSWETSASLSYSDMSSLHSNQTNTLMMGSVDTAADASSAISSEQEDSVLEINQARFGNGLRNENKEPPNSANSQMQVVQDDSDGGEDRTYRSKVSRLGKKILNTLN